MTSFAALLDNPSGRLPADVQAEAEREFTHRIRSSQFRLRDPAEPVPNGTYVVIGVATYSPLELGLLDEVAARSLSAGMRIDVFSTRQCASMDDFRRFVPGLNCEIRQTPVLGFWRDGVLLGVHTGLADVRAAIAGLTNRS